MACYPRQPRPGSALHVCRPDGRPDRCGSTFVETIPYAGTRSAGTCTASGHEVLLRVFPVTGSEASYSWIDGFQAARPDNSAAVGDGWVMIMPGKDRDAFNTVSMALTST